MKCASAADDYLYFEAASAFHHFATLRGRQHLVEVRAKLGGRVVVAAAAASALGNTEPARVAAAPGNICARHGGRRGPGRGANRDSDEGVTKETK